MYQHIVQSLYIIFLLLLLGGNSIPNVKLVNKLRKLVNHIDNNILHTKIKCVNII